MSKLQSYNDSYEIDDDEGSFEQQDLHATMEELDTYLEKLYEVDMHDKKQGTFMIMQLARNPENLEALVTNEPLLGALSRVLKEEGKKSMDLVINILYVFYSFSHFSQFHQIITTYNVGSIVMKTIEYETMRYEELSKRLKSSGKEAQRIGAMLLKQEKLLYVCFHILLNLAEDINVEAKMRKRKLIPSLITMLDRDNPDLIVLVLTFLKKLSIFKENKDEMTECDVVPKLLRFIPNQNETLLNVALKLLLNLSFDEDIRAEISSKCLPRLIGLLHEPAHMEIIIKLLYQLSMDDKCRSMFFYNDANPLGDILKIIIDYPEAFVDKHVMALAINLVNNAKNAEKIVQQDPGTLQRLFDRLSKTHDPLLAKMLRNIAQHDKLRLSFKKYVPDLIAMMISTDNADFLVEVLGILGSLGYKDYSFSGFFKQCNLVEFFYRYMQPGVCEDDILLELVVALGTVISDEESANFIAKSPVIRSLCDLFIDKQEDDEIVLQVLYTFYKILLFEPTRIVFMQQHQIINSLVDLLQDNNVIIQQMADRILDLVMDCDEQWREQLRRRKFEVHNRRFIAAVEGDSQQYYQQTEDDDGVTDIGLVENQMRFSQQQRPRA